MRFIIIIFIVLTIKLPSQCSDIISTTGNINFDANNDGVAEANLSSSGLSIGSTAASANLHVSGNAIIEGNVVIGNMSEVCTLNIGGTLGMASVTSTDNLTLGNSSIYFINSSSGNINVQLPQANTMSGRSYIIKKISSSNKVKILGNSSYIDNLSVLFLNENTTILPYVNLISDNDKWRILSKSDGVTDISSDNLLLWWGLDETSGTSISDLKNSFNGTNYNNFNFSGNSVSGNIGNAATVSGNGIASLAYSAQGPIGSINTGDFTFSIWTQNDPGADEDRTFFDNLAGGGGILFWRATAGALTVYVGGFSEIRYDYTVPLDNSMNHYLMLRESGQIRVYVNGVERTNTTGSTSQAGTIVSGFDLFLGMRRGGLNDERFYGKLDDFRIYNKALSVEEIQTLYLLGK